MVIKRYYFSSQFEKKIRSFSSKQQKKVEKRIDLFLKDPFNPSLKTHKLKGKLSNYWSFSLAFKERVLFEFIDKETIAFIDIGSHEIYQ